MKVFPPNILKCMSPADRKALGKAGLTPEEALQKAETKSEKELQSLIVALLRLKGIEPIVSAMNKRTTNNVGLPDILFAVNGRRRFYACAWEIKMPGSKLSWEQVKMAERLEDLPNGWNWRVIRSVDEALEELRRMGIE